MPEDWTPVQDQASEWTPVQHVPAAEKWTPVEAAPAPVEAPYTPSVSQRAEHNLLMSKAVEDVAPSATQAEVDPFIGMAQAGKVAANAITGGVAFPSALPPPDPSIFSPTAAIAHVLPKKLAEPVKRFAETPFMPSWDPDTKNGAVRFMSGVYDTIRQLGTPEGIALIAAMHKFPLSFQTTVGKMFQALMARSTAANAIDATRKFVRGDTAEAFRALGETAGGAALLGVSALGERTPVVDGDTVVLKNPKPVTGVDEAYNASLQRAGVDISTPTEVVDAIKTEKGIKTEPELAVGGPISKTEGNQVTLETGRPSEALHELSHLQADEQGTPEPPENNTAIVANELSQRLFNEPLAKTSRRPNVEVPPPDGTEGPGFGFAGPKDFVPSRVTNREAPAVPLTNHWINKGIEAAGRLAIRRTATAAEQEPFFRFVGQTNRVRDMVMRDKTLQSFSNWFFDNASSQDRVKWIDQYTRGGADIVDNPMAQKWFRFAKPVYDGLYSELRTSIKGKDIGFIPDYVNRLWEVPPKGAEELVTQVFGQKTMSGGTGFTKERFHELIQAGIDRGGKLVSDNPADLLSMYAESVERTKAKAQMLENSLAKGLAFPDAKAPETYRPIASGWYNEFPGYSFAPGTANLFDRYLSPMPGKTLRALQGVKNFTTQIELASGFHATTMTNEALTQGYGVAIGHLNSVADWVNNKVLGKNMTPSVPANVGVWDDFARAARSPRDMYDVGNLFIKSRPTLLFGSVDAAAAKSLAKTLKRQGLDADLEIQKFYEAAAGRVTQAPGMRTRAAEAMKDAMLEKTLVGDLWRATARGNNIITQGMSWLFDGYIPRLKVGAYFQELPRRMQFYADKIASGEIDPDVIRRQTWDAVENRFGEMDLTREAWNNTFRTGAQILFRAVSWKYGSLRQYGNAIARQFDETAEAFSDGRIPRIAPDMQWALGSLFVHMTEASMLQYAFTGEMPSSTLDYFFPKVGGKDKYGNDNRIVPPDYVKDMVHLGRSIKQTGVPEDYVMGAMSRLVSGIRDFARGYNYYGEEIPRNIGGLLGAVMPTNIALSSIESGRATGQPPAATALSVVGVSKAPGWATRTEMQNRALEVAHKNIRIVSKAQSQLRKKMSEATMQARRGEQPKVEGLTDQQVAVAQQRATKDPIESMIRSASYGDALYIMDAASPDELAKYWYLVPGKAGQANIAEEERPMLLRKQQEIESRMPQRQAWVPVTLGEENAEQP